MEYTFVISDKQDITRYGIQYILHELWPNSVRYEADGKHQLMDLLATHSTAITVIDHSLMELETMDELFHIKTRFPNTIFVLFSDEFTAPVAKQAIYTSNSISLLHKQASAQELHAALQLATQGQRYVASALLELLADNTDNNHGNTTPPTLTGTEIEVLQLIAQGLSTKEVANKRHISQHTVVAHRKNIFRKLGVNTVHEATRYALRMGLVDMADYLI